MKRQREWTGRSGERDGKMTEGVSCDVATPQEECNPHYCKRGLIQIKLKTYLFPSLCIDFYVQTKSMSAPMFR